MKRYKVTISNRGHIPGMGNGPFMRPLAISESQYKSLIKLGYKVKIVEDLLAKAKIITSSQFIKVEKPIIEEKLPEPKNEEIIKEKPSKKESKPKKDELAVEEVVEETVEEKYEDEILVDDPDLSAEAYYNKSFLTSKNICKKILNARMVQYETSASIAMLRKLVLDSNPNIDDSIEE